MWLLRYIEVYNCDTVPALPLKNNGGHIQLPVVREIFDTVVKLHISS